MAETWQKLIDNLDYAKGKRAILTPAGAIVPATAGAEQKQTNGTNFSYYVLAYDKAADENAFWEFLVPDDYAGGNVTVNIWYKTAVTTGAVVFAVQTLGREEGEALDSALGAAQSVTDTVPATAGNIGICAPTAFSPGWAAGDYVVVKLYRDADNGSDTADADAEVVMVELEYI